MTLKNSSLGDRLNDFKHNTDQESEEKSQNSNSHLLHSLIEVRNSIISLIVICIKSIILGYSIKLIFHMDWNFWGLLCIGFSIDFIFQHLYELIHGKQ